MRNGKNFLAEVLIFILSTLQGVHSEQLMAKG
jgi:hypothetical protein